MRGRERDYSRRWIKKLREKYENSFVYKIPDSPFGGVKPYDAFAFISTSDGCSKAYALEFKMITNDLTPNQMDALKKSAKAGAISLVVYFGNRGVVEKIDRICSDGRRESFDKEGP